MNLEFQSFGGDVFKDINMVERDFLAINKVGSPDENISRAGLIYFL